MNDARLPVRTKLAFGVGASAEIAIGIGFSAFFILFYNRNLGVPATWCGIALAVALIVDAISDPLIGSLSDRWRSRLGRRHPFLFASAIPLGLCFAALYNPPDGLDRTGLFFWLFGWTVAMRQCLTFYSVPHLALGAELSTDYIERTRVMAHNALFGVFGGAGIYLISWQWFDSQPGGSLDAANYPPMAIAGGAFAAFVILFSAWFTRDRIPHMRTPPAPPPFSFRQFWTELSDCMRVRNYRMLLAGLVFLSAATGIREAVNAYMGLFFWELDEGEISYFGLATPPAYMLAFAIVPRLHRTFDKRWNLVAGILVVAIAAVTPIALRLLGLFPENGDPWVWRWVMTSVFVFYLGIAILNITVMSALADVADELELANGRRQEGILYAARTFFGKSSQAIGILVSGVIIDAIGFEPGATPGAVDPEVIYRMGFLDGPIAAIPAFVAIYFYGSYRIDKEKHDAILAGLETRRRAEASAESSA